VSRANPDTLPGRDRAHVVSVYIGGFHTPRAWWRSLSPGRYRRACLYVWAMIAAASDNIVPRSALKRPRWFPKRYIWGDPKSPRKW
jgi:hypothetical protein